MQQMRLHEAVALGLGEIHFTNSLWLAPDTENGGCRGCLLGAALFAQGERGGKKDDDIDVHLSKYWPWVRDWRYTGDTPGLSSFVSKRKMSEILTYLASCKQAGAMTDEQIIDFIRSIEPQEQEPSAQVLRGYDARTQTWQTVEVPA